MCPYKQAESVMREAVNNHCFVDLEATPSLARTLPHLYLSHFHQRPFKRRFSVLPIIIKNFVYKLLI